MAPVFHLFLNCYWHQSIVSTFVMFNFCIKYLQIITFSFYLHFRQCPIFVEKGFGKGSKLRLLWSIVQITSTWTPLLNLLSPLGPICLIINLLVESPNHFSQKHISIGLSRNNWKNCSIRVRVLQSQFFMHIINVFYSLFDLLFIHYLIHCILSVKSNGWDNVMTWKLFNDRSWECLFVGMFEHAHLEGAHKQSYVEKAEVRIEEGPTSLDFIT